MRSKLLLAGLMALTTVAKADLIKVAVNGGFTTVTMADVNDSLDKQKKSSEASGSTVTLNAFNSGWFVAAEAGLGLMPFLEVGPRVEYLQANPLEMTTVTGGSKNVTRYDATLTSAMLGVNVGMDMPLTGLGFNVGAYAGHGYAVVKGDSKTNGTLNGAAQFTGGGFVSELQAKLKYSILPLVSLDLLGGMRFAAVGVLSDGVKNSTQSYDFSGINAGGGLTIGF